MKRILLIALGLLIAAALSACPEWQPAYKDGKPVKVICQSSTNFYQPN